MNEQEETASADTTIDTTPKRPWTPGPWAKDYGLTVGHIKSTAQIDKSQTVARYDILPGLLMPEAEQQANAHLIACAPELFEALEDCESGLQYILGRYGELEGVGFDRAISKARAALAKALGGQP